MKRRRAAAVLQGDEASRPASSATTSGITLPARAGRISESRHSLYSRPAGQTHLGNSGKSAFIVLFTATIDHGREGRYGRNRGL